MLGAHRPPSPLTGLEYSQVQLSTKVSVASFVQTLIVAPPNQADMALSALYLHNVNHRAAARPSLGQLSAYNFQVSAISSYDQWKFVSEKQSTFKSQPTHLIFNVHFKQEEPMMDDNENAPLLRVDS